MIKRWFVFGAIAIFGAMGIVLSPATSGQKDVRTAGDIPPTEITLGAVVTDEEREFSREYKRIFPDVQRKALTEVAQLAKSRPTEGITTLTIGVPSMPGVPGEQQTFDEFIKKLVCEADAVVLGDAKSPVGHLTEDQTLAYTEYELLPREVLKDNKNAAVEIGKPLVITRPGGLLRISGQLIRVDNKSYKQLDPNKSYLLFLRYLPKAKGYIVSNPRADFLIDGTAFSSISGLGVPTDANRFASTDNLLSLVRNGAGTACAQKDMVKP